MSIADRIRNIAWKQTLIFAAMRIAAASLVWIVFMTIKDPPGGVVEFLTLLIAAPGVVTIFCAVAFVCLLLSQVGVPWIGLFGFMCAIFIWVGDPILWLIFTIRREWSPIAEQRLFHPTVVIVTKDQSGEADEPDGPAESRPEIGRIDVDRTASSGGAGNKERAQTLYREGRALLLSGEGEQIRIGLNKYIEATSVDPHCIDAHLELGRAFFRLDAVEHSNLVLSSAKSILAVDPGHSEAIQLAANTHFALGKTAWDKEDYRAATSAFAAAYALTPAMEHLAEALAHCAEKAHTLDQSISAFEKRLESDPDDIDALVLAGRSYVKLATSSDGRQDSFRMQTWQQKAEQHLSSALRLQPLHVGANYWLGGLLAMNRRDAEVRKIVELLRPIDAKRSVDLEALLETHAPEQNAPSSSVVKAIDIPRSAASAAESASESTTYGADDTADDDQTQRNASTAVAATNATEARKRPETPPSQQITRADSVVKPMLIPGIDANLSSPFQQKKVLYALIGVLCVAVVVLVVKVISSGRPASAPVAAVAEAPKAATPQYSPQVQPRAPQLPEKIPTLPPSSEVSDRGNGSSTVISAPPMHVGDTFVTETTDHINAKLSNIVSREVVEVGASGYQMTFVNLKSKFTRTLNYDGEGNLVSSRSPSNEGSDYLPPIRFFKFPMQPGDEWQQNSQERNTKTGAVREHHISAKVLGYESITVPAGTCNALKIAIRNEVFDGQELIQRGSDTSWFCPDFKRTIRSELESIDRDGTVGRRTVVLNSYHLE